MFPPRAAPIESPSTRGLLRTQHSMNNIRVLLVLVLLVTGVVAPAKPKKKPDPTITSHFKTTGAPVTNRKRKSNPTQPSSEAPAATAACSSSSSSSSSSSGSSKKIKTFQKKEGCPDVVWPEKEAPAKKKTPRKCHQVDGYVDGPSGSLGNYIDVSSNKETKEGQSQIRVTLELDPETTTFQHHVGPKEDQAERECSPWAGNNPQLFGKACPQMWGPSKSENGKWNCYDAETPLQMNGSGQYAASHVYIKIGDMHLSGLWVIPLSAFANSYANAEIWTRNPFPPTRGYTDTWHKLRVPVTAIRIGQYSEDEEDFDRKYGIFETY